MITIFHVRPETVVRRSEIINSVKTGLDYLKHIDNIEAVCLYPDQMEVVRLAEPGSQRWPRRLAMVGLGSSGEVATATDCTL